MEMNVEVVKSMRGKNKICINGYIYTEERQRNTEPEIVKFYWKCENWRNSNCAGRAVTHFNRNVHDVVRLGDHNHAPNASKVQTDKISNELKNLGKNSNDRPIQIVQSVTARASLEVRSNLPSRDAMRRQVKRARRTELLAEPNTLNDIDIPNQYQMTLAGQNFCRDIIVDNERLLFTSDNNIRYLNRAQFWIMDGTFKTVPNIFIQLYTIHAPVGVGQDKQILPLLYALMSSKSEELYRRLFRELNDLAFDLNLDLRPEFVLTDFELASMNAIRYEFPGVQNKGCLFHLAQSTFRKIQQSQLAARYGNDANFSLMMRHLPALAFLNNLEIP